MWIIKAIECKLHGHSDIDINTGRRPYHYCLHCGRVEEPVAILKRHQEYPIKSQPSVSGL